MSPLAVPKLSVSASTTALPRAAADLDQLAENLISLQLQHNMDVEPGSGLWKFASCML